MTNAVNKANSFASSLSGLIVSASTLR